MSVSNTKKGGVAEKARNLVESQKFQNLIIGVIIINAVVLGLQTSHAINRTVLHLLDRVDQLCLSVFVIELLLKLVVCRLRFFRDGWNVFDFLVVAIALGPSEGGLAILRAFRIFRVMRLVTAIQSMRRVVSGMLMAIPGVGSVGGLLLLVFYISAVLTTNFFGQKFPEWFGDIGLSMYTLFQVMTLESWSMGIVRPVMAAFPYAWLFFVPFIMVTTFTVLNLFIGIIVDAMGTVKEQEHLEAHGKEEEQTVENIAKIQVDIDQIKETLRRMETRG